MIKPPIRAAALAGLILAAPPLRAMQRDSVPSRPALVALDAPMVIEVDSLDRAAFANVAELLQARVPALHISRNGDGGMRWYMRGPSSLWGSVPMVIVDEVRRNMAGSSMREFGTRPSPLDDIDIEDVERIEVWAGPATAARYGTNAGHGVIRIVSFAPRAQGTSFRITTAAGVANEAVSYPANFNRPGVDTAGNRIRYCTLTFEAEGRCTPTGPLTSINVLESDSPFETAVAARVAAVLASGNERLAWRGGGSFDRQATTTGTLASQRFHVRGAGALRAAERADLTIRAHWMRGEADLPSVNEPSVLRQGLLARADTAWQGFVQPHPSQYLAMRYGATAIGRWQPRAWLEARLTSGFERLRDEDDLEYTVPLTGGFGPLRVAADGKNRRRDVTARLEAEARYGTSARPHATALSIEYARSKQEDEFHEFQGTDASYFERRFWVHRRTEITGVGLMQQLHLGPRVAFTGGLRLDRVKLRDVRWDVPLSPQLSLSWDVRRFTPAPLGGVRFRAALGEVANLPQATSLFLPFGSPPEKPKAEVAREHELGFDVQAARDRVGLSVTWYSKRTRDILDVVDIPFFGPARIEVLNRGIEASLHARILTTSRLSWDARASYAHNHNKVTQSEAQHLIEFDETGVLNRQFVSVGHPLGAQFTYPIVSVRDLDGDGVVDGGCFEGSGDCEVIVSLNPEFHSAFPPTTASLETSVRFGPLTLTALLDHKGGHTIFNIPLHQRCLFLACQASYDPQSPFRDQAELLLIQQGMGPAIQDATYTKLREISLRFAAPASWAQVLGGSRLDISLAGRNVATWTDYRGLDPETTSLPWIPLASLDNAAAPMPRRFLVRVDLHGR